MDPMVYTNADRLNKRLNTVYDKFQSKTEGKTIADYYDIKDCDCLFKLTRTDMNVFEFEFHFKRRFQLPLITEINKHIRSFLVETAVFQVIYPLDYPFVPPIWRLKHKNSNQAYSQILENHNCAYTLYWSPAMSFDNDILCMIEKLATVARTN